ncbi:XIAP-associated factor 1 [Genypterus blacodes]|uniref:XIAP-associated factor 1 n=1 Tax=Genypterus blacodes TaxID=154954 RepID=UPI003F76015D
MEAREATRVCGECNKEVAEANFTLHESHCRRFLSVCPDCDEPVPTDQLSQHRQEQHTLVRCTACNQKVERCQLVDHETDRCAERLQCCRFCELAVPWHSLQEHSHACGSRTELCRDCGHYVTLRDQPQHAATCPGTEPDPGPQHAATSASAPPRAVRTPPRQLAPAVMCRRCMASFPAKKMEEHQLQCAGTSRWEEEEEEAAAEAVNEDEDLFSGGVSSLKLNSPKKVFSLSDRSSRGPGGDRGDLDGISTCPHCHLVLPDFVLRWHKVKCQIYTHILK